MSQQHQRTLYSLDGNFDVEAELQEKLGGNTPQPPQPSWPRLQKSHYCEAEWSVEAHPRFGIKVHDSHVSRPKQ